MDENFGLELLGLKKKNQTPLCMPCLKSLNFSQFILILQWIIPTQKLPTNLLHFNFFENSVREKAVLWKIISSKITAFVTLYNAHAHWKDVLIISQY